MQSTGHNVDASTVEQIYFVQFADDLREFRIAEFNSLLYMLGLDPFTVHLDSTHAAVLLDDFELLSNAPVDSAVEKAPHNDVKPPRLVDCPVSSEHFIFIRLPHERLAQDICNRSVLIRAIYQYWAHGSSVESAAAATRALPAKFVEPYMHGDNTWSIQVESFCRSLSMDEKQEYRQHFSFLRFQGAVRIADPIVNLWIVADFSPIPVAQLVESSPPAYFGRLVARCNMQDILKKFDLKKRLYLGPTSLNEKMAFVMANLCRVDVHSLVFDPFAGTGSILLALTQFGAKCVGADIDTRVLKGEMHGGKYEPSELSAENAVLGNTSSLKKTCKVNNSVRRDIFANFEAYGLPPPDLVRLDNHLVDRHFNATGAAAAAFNGLFDAIVTDPPYGIRAGARKSGKKNLPTGYVVDPLRRHDHIPATQQYAVEEVMLDLLHSSARLLTVGGLLSYLIPIPYSFDRQRDLPVHPCLQILGVCQQSLSARHGRCAVVVKKNRPYTAELQQEFERYKADVLSGNDVFFGTLISRLEAALAADAYDNETVVKHMSSHCQRRKEGKKGRRLHNDSDGQPRKLSATSDDK